MEFARIKDMIAKIEGIINIKLVSENDEIAEVHILANNLRAPKQIVRDIESSLLAAFDYRIDRKVISIAQIQTEDNKAIRRIKYSGIDLKTEGNALECTVSLLQDGEEFGELISCIKTVANRRKIVADATIRTIEKILGQIYLFNIEDVIINSSRDIDYASVLVNLVLNENEQTIVGSAIVKHDVNEAIVKATLDAVNRKIQGGAI